MKQRLDYRITNIRKINGVYVYEELKKKETMLQMKAKTKNQRAKNREKKKSCV